MNIIKKFFHDRKQKKLDEIKADAKFFHDRKQKKLDEIKADAERKEAAKNQRLAEISKAEMKMLSTHCPIVKGKCMKSCIHFKSGHLSNEYHFSELRSYSFVVTVMPKCKLWKD